MCRAVFISHLCYPHIVDVFTNHVGDGALDVPLPFAHTTLRYPHNVRHNCVKHHHYKFITQTLIPPQLAVGANIVRPSLFAHMVCTNSNLENPRKRDVEGAVPCTFVLIVCPPQNRCRSLRILPPIRGHKKAVQSFHSDTALVCSFILIFFYCLSAPLSRLAPIEALPISCERSRTRNLLRNGLCPLTPQALWRRA